MIQIFSKEMSDVLSKPNATLVYFVEIKTDEPLYLNTGVTDIRYQDQIWYGIGQIGDIGGVTQKSSIGGNPISFSINALEDDAIKMAFDEGLILKDAKVYLVALDENHSEVIKRDLIYTGFISDVGVVYGGDNAISIEVSNKNEKWTDGLPFTYSESSHRLKYPNDRFFRYTIATSKMSIKWGDTKDDNRERYRGQ